MRRRFIYSCFFISILLGIAVPVYAADTPLTVYTIKPGDTWIALTLRFDLPKGELLSNFGSINPQRQPVIGSQILLPQSAGKNGKLIRPFSGGLLQTAVENNVSPWALALLNNQHSPYTPQLFTLLYIPNKNTIPRELPFGFQTLSLNPSTAVPGQALLLNALTDKNLETSIDLEQAPWIINHNGKNLAALTATGAFFHEGQYDLNIHTPGKPLWTQPWLFAKRDWNFEQIEFSAMPATDPELMRLERTRLQEIWSQVTPAPLWKGSYQWPIKDFVELTSHYGARRSVNGGGYDTYHEGTDFSAYRGTPVYAPAGGQVVLAEPLIVRGGTVILDHGLGIHTGYYHLSEIAVTPGQTVKPGDILGKVGSTGRSTGNHLHWDMLIGTTWVDAESWMKTGLAAHILNAWGANFPELDLSDMPPKSQRTVLKADRQTARLKTLRSRKLPLTRPSK